MLKVKLSALCILFVLISGCSLNAGSNTDIASQSNSNVKNNTEKKSDDSAPSVNNVSTEYKRISVTLSNSVDGDTIEVGLNGKREKVRFLLVDSPETSHPRLGEQPYGQEAKIFTKNMVTNAKKIELEFDIGPTRDKYNRLLAYVYIDGKMLQEELLRNGLARVAYVYPPNTRYVDQFRAIQEQAQQKGIGIWQFENYTQENGFHPEIIEGGNETSEKQDITVPANPKKSQEDCKIKGNISSKGEKIYHT